MSVTYWDRVNFQQITEFILKTFLLLFWVFMAAFDKKL